MTTKLLNISLNLDLKRRKENNMIEQKRFIDDSEGADIWQWIYDVIDKYKLRERFTEVELRTRAIAFDCTSDNHWTDDRIVQLVVDNRLVAFVISRRDDWNWTECTFVFIEPALKACEDFQKKIS